MPKPRITYIIYKLPPRTTGAGLRTLRYLSQEKLGHEIAFIITKRNHLIPFLEYQNEQGIFQFSSKLFKEVYILKNIFVNKVFKHIHNSINYLIIFPQLLCFFLNNKGKFDIIHVLGWNKISIVTTILSKLFNKKVVIELTLLGEPPKLVKSWNLIKLMINRIDYYIYRNADAYIALSEALKEELLSINVDISRIRIIENPVNAKIFYKIDYNKKQELKNKNGFDQNSLLLLFIGNIEKRKGASAYPDIINIILKAFPNSYFLFLGEYEQTSEQLFYYNKLLNNVNISERLIFYGSVTNANEYMLISDYLIFPSLNEGLPNAVIEAMACGLPVIMNYIDGISDFVIQNGENGFYIYNNEKEKYLEILQKLEGNKSEYERISNNAAISIEEKFTMENRNSKLFRLYNEIIENYD